MNSRRTIRIGLAGNPNTGKTTVFNAITGARQKTGNYAGVTVEKKEGRRIYRDVEFIVYDLPGTYSLTAYSLDEVIARDFILEEKPDVIVDVLDATNLERNLYLCLQLQELAIPMVGAINIADQAEAMGIHIDTKKLAVLLGMPVVRTVSTKGTGIEDLLDTVIAASRESTVAEHRISYGHELEAEIAALAGEISRDENFSRSISPRWLAVKLLEKDANAREKLSRCSCQEAVNTKTAECIARIEQHFGRDAEIVVTEQRYAYVHGIVAESVSRGTGDFATATEGIDKLLMNRFLGLPLFMLILWLIFQVTFKLGQYPTDWLNAFFAYVGTLVSSSVPPGILHSLLVDGIIGGLSGVLSFVPLIAILFLCISFLEDTGYMARAAFTMDKFLHIFGLHGQSFVPMMLGFGCSVPAVMAARTLKSPRDRIITVLIIPFMSCGAKLPVHVLLAGTFFGTNAGTYVMAVYLIGVTLALLSSYLFQKTVLRGDATPFVMELPPYRMPTTRGIIWHVVDKTGQYLKKAGTVLLAASILIWVVVSFPKPREDSARYQTIAQEYRATHVDVGKIRSEIAGIISGEIRIDTMKDETRRSELSAIMTAVASGAATPEEKVQERADALAERHAHNIRSEEELSFSIAGRLGKAIEPVVRPMGFDWRIAISAVTGFAAKEAVVSTLGVLYKVGSGANETTKSLRQSLLADRTFNPLVAFVLMLFTLIVPPCISAMSMIRAEIGWKWLGFAILYMVTLAWLLCSAVYQIGRAVGLGV